MDMIHFSNEQPLDDFKPNPHYSCKLVMPKRTEEDKRMEAEMLELMEATFPLTNDQAYRLNKRWVEPVRLSKRRLGYVNPLWESEFPA